MSAYPRVVCGMFYMPMPPPINIDRFVIMLLVLASSVLLQTFFMKLTQTSPTLLFDQFEIIYKLKFPLNCLLHMLPDNLSVIHY